MTDTPRLQPSSPAWLQSRQAAWITPQGDYHPLKGQEHHHQWLKKRGHMTTEKSTSHHFVKDGWIRKSAKNIYWAREGDEQKVFDHVNSTHPDVSTIRLHTHDPHPGSGTESTRALWRRVGTGSGTSTR